MSGIFDATNRLGRDQAEGWFSFKSIGDRIGGTILDIWFKPAEGLFKEQRCFTIKDELGKVLNVGIKMNAYTLPRTDELQIGDELGLSYDKDVASRQGGHPAKSITIFSKMNGPRTGKNAKFLGSAGGSISSTAIEEVADEDVPL